MGLDEVMCAGTSVIAVLSDVKYGKISNRLVFPMFAFGILWRCSEAGLDGLLGGVLGGGLPLVLYPFFIMRMLGAGDIKLLMALGVWVGLEDCARLIILSILCGGIIAAAVMAAHCNGRVRLKKLGIYIKTCLLSRKMWPYQDLALLESGAALPFALAVLGGVACLMAGRIGLIPQLI